LNGFWVEAKDLRVGDVFLGANGELSTLTNIVRVEQAGGIAVFNFTVEGNHNYYILAKEYEYGQSCVLVHNAKCRNPNQRPRPDTSKNKPAVLDTDATGKVHGDIPKSVPKSWSQDELLEVEAALKDSISVRKAEQLRLGEHGPHRARIAEEDNFLRMVVKVKSGT